MIYVVIHPTANGGVLFSGAYSNLRAANECADEADFYQGLVFAVDMNEVQDKYTGGANVELDHNQTV
jgi:hypothetical protein